MTDYSEYRYSAIELLGYVLEGAGIAVLAAYIFYRSIIAFFIMLPAGLIYPVYKKRSLVNIRKQKLESEFKEAIQILASMLSAGYSMENAIKESIGELRTMYGEKSLMVTELENIDKRLQMNITVEDAFEDFAVRSGVDSIRSFAGVLRVAKRSGGELVSVIRHTSGIIGDRIRIKEEILTLTASRRFEQRIMNVFPMLIILYIDISSPGFFTIMYTSIAGRIAMSASLFVYIAALYMAGRLLELEV